MTGFHPHDIILPEVYNPQEEEHKILKLWHKEKTFENLRKSRQEKNDGKFTFHSAPVSPKGHPHSGHILNSVVKDVLKRYGYQRNLRVESAFRWDNHGLPIEYEVDKKLGLKQLKDFQNFDVKSYNEECRAFTEKYIPEWKLVFERLGNCLDSSREYRTSDTKYMECVWRVFKSLYDKGLVYKDTKTLPYSTACFTHLSNFEANQNLKTVSEVGTVISLNIVDSSEKLLLWTTTPWTLAFNSVLCVNPKALYVKIKVEDHVYVLSKNHLDLVYKNPSDYTILEEISGAKLADLNCEPLFDPISPSTGYSVSTNLLSNDVGTGITASDGCMMDSLKGGHMLCTKEVQYKKPYCWQSDTPLVKKSVQSWFIRVESIIEDLKKNISSVNWHPNGKISQEDLTDWLENQPADWSISRSRNWGTPLPIWSSPSGDEICCVGSVKELEEISGNKNITDLHRETIDWIVIPSRIPGNPPLRRVPDVFDCWFESGVLPFMWKSDQADFVAESIDQTKGWFYTTLVLATGLSETPPFRDVFAHGLPLEANGSKVIKHKHNRNDPIRLMEKYGSDALRLYLLSCSVSNFMLKEEGVAMMAETIIQPLYRIFYKCTAQLESPRWVNYGYMTHWYTQCMHPIDLWILSSAESLLNFYTEEMNAYRLNTFLPKVIDLLKTVEEWYIPLRCPKNIQKDPRNCSSIVIFNVIYKLCIILTPVAPFITEHIYQIQKQWMVFYLRHDSILEAPLLKPNEQMIRSDLEQTVERLQNIVGIVRSQRAHHMIPIQYQIQEIVVIHQSEEVRNGITMIKEDIKKLLNAVDVRVSTGYSELGVELCVNLRKSSPPSRQKILDMLTKEQINSLLSGSDLDQQITLEDIEVSYRIQKDVGPNCSIVAKDDLIVIMKMNKVIFFYEDGTVKELVKRIGNLKKKSGYYRTDRMVIHYSTEDDCLRNVIDKHCKHLNETNNCDLRLKTDTNSEERDGGRLEERIIVKGAAIDLYYNIKCE